MAQMRGKKTTFRLRLLISLWWLYLTDLVEEVDDVLLRFVAGDPLVCKKCRSCKKGRKFHRILCTIYVVSNLH
jgi:hypothetical protein